MVEIGSKDMNRLLIVKRLKATSVLDGSGKIDETVNSNWEEFGRIWCQMITTGSREFLVGDQINQQISHQVTTRWSKKASQFTTEMRLEYNQRRFNISGPPQNVDEKNRWIRFPAVEVK